ncbi:MAG: hypothetical protein CM15mP44_7860 [Candidatus Neomarinimicrobiota bacterium]|nr:MAG: hypothetical protein CM15mP44_7860 [Candidatus Neomarinimicrobiota bacterium]
MNLNTYFQADQFKKIRISYRVISLCGGDLIFSGKKFYDLEIGPGKKNGGSFRNFELRLVAEILDKGVDKKLNYSYLNGWGFPTPRFGSLLET